MQRWGGGTAPAQKTATTSGPGSPVLCGDCPCESGGARRSVGWLGWGALHTLELFISRSRREGLTQQKAAPILTIALTSAGLPPACRKWSPTSRS